MTDEKLDIGVTDGHRIFTLKRGSGNKFSPATDTADSFVGGYTSHRRIPQAGRFWGSPSKHVDSAQAALISFYVADGHLPKKSKQAQSHFRKERKVVRVMELLRVLGIDHSKSQYEDDVVIRFRPPAWVSDCYTETGEKKFPDWFIPNTPELWEATRHATLESDGNVATRSINTTSTVVAHQIQVMALLNGEAMNIRSYTSPDSNTATLYKQTYQKTNYISYRADRDQFRSERWEGRVVCFSVPSSYLVVRRAGKAFISGNCEVMTHRQLSRNAASSRAIPTKKVREAVTNNPAYPEWWGANQCGMQAKGEVDTDDRDECLATIAGLRFHALRATQELSEYGLHKQIVNRYLEPWFHVTMLITATEWDNFFALRAHPDAQPELQVLAYRMLNEYLKNEPRELKWNGWHIPFVDYYGDHAMSLEEALIRSVACAARTSYTTHDGNFPIEEQRKFVERLRSAGHWSPFEHQAQAKHGLHMSGNFRGGWEQYRQTFNNHTRTIPSLQEVMDSKPDWITL